MASPKREAGGAAFKYPPTPAVAGERVREAILAVFFSGAESDVRQSLVQKATLGSSRARRSVGPSLPGGCGVLEAAPGKLGSVAI